MKTIRPELSTAVDADNYLGETPVWSVAEQALYWVNCEDPPEIHRWHPATGERKVWPMEQRVGGIVLKQSGGVLVTLADGLYDMDLASGELTLRAAARMEHAHLHECAVDRQGRLWVGGMDHRVSAENPDPCGASLFRLDGDRLVELLRGISCSNGLAFSPDGRTLYHSDSPTCQVHAFDLDPATGALSNQRLFFALGEGEGFCDGSTVDAEGGYWATLVFASKLRRYLPDGTLDLEVELPFPAPTKPAFGGPDLETLYLTSTKMSMGGPGSPLDGAVLAFKPGVRGLPEPLLAD